MISRASLSRRRRLGQRQIRRWCCENKSPRFIGRVGTTRKWFGHKTIQERKAEEREADFLAEILEK